MSELSRAIRQKRFNVKKEISAKIVVDTRTGDQIEFDLDNCSINGMGGTAKNLSEADCEIGGIFPAAKIVINKQEFGIGRLTVRYFHKREQGDYYIGLATVDAKLPIDGALSHYLDAPKGTDLNPYQYELSPDKYSLATFVEQQDTNVDLFGRCRKFDIFHKEWQKTDKFQYYTVREAASGVRVKLKRARPNGRKDYIQMAAYDYLNLGNHPEVIEAATAATKKYGYSSGGSPVITGQTDLHEELAETLARMLRKDKVLLFSSGYAANVGTIHGLTSGQDLIVADLLAHASIQDGIKMASATARLFKHNNMDHLEKILSENRPGTMGALIITEGAFSMDGDFGDLRGVVALAKEYNCRTMVDEAHSFGIYGDKKLGIAEMQGVLGEVDIVMSSLSKVCGASGGFIAGPKEVMDWLIFYGRSHLFSGSMPPSSVAAALKSLEIMQKDQRRHESLFANVRHFVEGMRNLGAPISADHNCPIVPVVIGDEAKLAEINQHIRDSGVFVVPIVYPGVSRSQCRFRFSLTSEHTTSDLDYVISVFEQGMQKANFSFANSATKKRSA